METGTATEAAQRFTLFDTGTVPPRERFDAWCALFPFTDMTPLRDAPYQSSALLYAGDDGSMLARIRMDATLSVFPEDRSDQVMLNLFVGGNSLVRHGGREDMVDAGTGFNLMDCAIPMQTVARMHESIHLLLPRARVTRLLGPRPAGDGKALRHLPETPLGRILKANLLAVTDHAMDLDAPAAAQAMDATRRLAMAYLAQFRKTEDAQDLDALLYDGACRYIEAHLDDPRLTAERVAAALRCSRTRLYRVFAEHGPSVAMHIRETRLLRSRTLLRDANRSIGDIALYCGYGDLPAYSKAFRRRFGMAPSAWRNEAIPG